MLLRPAEMHSRLAGMLSVVLGASDASAAFCGLPADHPQVLSQLSSLRAGGSGCPKACTTVAARRRALLNVTFFR